MKIVSKEVKMLIVSKAMTITAIKDVMVNGKPGFVLFKKFTTANFTDFGLLPCSRYFICVTDKDRNEIITFECVTKEEGNSLYKYVKESKELNYSL